MRNDHSPRLGKLQTAAVVFFVLAVGTGAVVCASQGESVGYLKHEGVVEFLRSDGEVSVRILVEIADEPSEWTKGLMGRSRMANDEGMLFIYPEEQPQVFWMRNTPISLDMIFIGTDGRVVRIARRTQPRSDRRYHSIYPARYVVEVRAGFADHHDIRKGTEFRWQRY